MEERGRARATVTRRLCTIAGLYKYAVEEELLDHSPAAHVRRPRLDYDPFSMPATMLSTSFDAGVPLRDVQEAALHADPRTTMRYDRARASLDRHATYIVAAYVAGAAR